jgi:hypothetical protein
MNSTSGSTNPSARQARRVAIVVFVAATAFFITLAALSPRRPWLRIMVAPAWIAGTAASGDANQPTSLILLLVLLVFSTALALLAARAVPSKGQLGPPSRGATAASLTALLAVLLLETAWARPIARSLRNITGVPGDVGSEFPAFVSLRLVPGLLGFAVLAVAATLAVIRFRPHLTRALQGTLWILNVFIILACYSWYFSPHVS